MIKSMKRCILPGCIAPENDMNVGIITEALNSSNADESGTNCGQNRSPWLDDVDFDILREEPIDPVSELDDRPAVRDLLKEKSGKIEKIRASLGENEPLFNPTKHDEIWLLRFAMSHKKSKNAIKAARECMAYRKEHGLDDTDVRNKPPHKETDLDSPCMQYLKYCDIPAIVSTVPDPTRTVVSFLFFDAIHHDRLFKELTDDELLAFFIRGNEFTFQWCDYITRTTGRLTKTLRIADFQGVDQKSVHIRQFRREGKLLNIMDGAYPQMLEMLVICNAPHWMNAPWAAIRPLFPKKVLSKMDFAQPKTDEQGRVRLLKHISEDNLPVAFGGKNAVQPWEW